MCHDAIPMNVCILKLSWFDSIQSIMSFLTSPGDLSPNAVNTVNIKFGFITFFVFMVFPLHTLFTLYVSRLSISNLAPCMLLGNIFSQMPSPGCIAWILSLYWFNLVTWNNSSVSETLLEAAILLQ